MEIEAQLLALWKQAFGDHGGFWELFLETGFSPERCVYLTEEDTVCAALCWFDCQYREENWAYVYAVVTHPDFRGRGLCRKLLARAERLWADRGYAGALLVPAEESLRQMYEKMGYESCTGICEISRAADGNCIRLTPLSIREYAAMRRAFLPHGGVIQEGENLRFLSAQAELLSAEDVLLAAWREDKTLHVMELLGDSAKAPGIVKALGCERGHFRMPGTDVPWAMGKKFREDTALPTYFGFAFD